MNKEEQIRRFIMDYPIEVPEQALENELNYIRLEMRHRMRYDTLTGGPHHFNADGELEQMEDELRQAAYYEAKYDLVIKDIMGRENFSVTRRELEEEAAAMAERQNSTVEMVYRFFGEDLAMLEKDLKRRKAEQWICEKSR